MPTTINDLPPECLQVILLQLEDDKRSLAQLLRVNHQFLQLTAPILYADPFIHCFDKSRPKLLKTLLHTSDGFSASFFSDLVDQKCRCPWCSKREERNLIAAIAVQASNEQIRTMAPYIDFMTVFRCAPWTVYDPLCTRDTSAFDGTTSSLCYFGIHNAVLQRCAPKIKTMVIEPYALNPDMLPLASRLTSLTRLKWGAAFQGFELDNLSQFLAELQGQGTMPRIRGPALEYFFLPKIINPCRWIYHDQEEMDQEEMDQEEMEQEQMEQDQLDRPWKIQLLLALGSVLSLDARNWLDFPEICDLIPSKALSRLEQFEHWIGFPYGQSGRFLQRCRALRQLRFGTYDRNVFAWAEEEKEKLIATGDLVQLKTLRISVLESIEGALLKSIFHGFSHSLEDLTCYVCDIHKLCHFERAPTPIEIITTADESFCLDYAVRMPRLKRLCIIQASSAVEIGQGAFQDCPVLEFLLLGGDVSCSNGMEGFDVFRIPSLKCLSLGNGVTKYFKPESIRHSPLLEKLTLRDNRTLPLHYDEADLFELSLGVWTWMMPRLNTIKLSGRSALLFKFEWIRRCPFLRTLAVDVLTPAMLEPNAEDIAKGPCGERLRTCHLNIFKQDINEEWFPKILETYCGHVVRLRLATPRNPSARWSGIDLGFALTATKALSSLETLTMFLGRGPALLDLVKRFGLVKGKQCHGDKATWRPSLKLKKLCIENSEGEGKDAVIGFYKQRKT
ncbi:MAG: hypothetical protein J3Q66DRAFT_404556 [Benniella sp.]|nr:MAG: hypothetical protein J3Q66DRAFT_404556 [Benniella sp.]